MATPTTTPPVNPSATSTSTAQNLTTDIIMTAPPLLESSGSTKRSRSSHANSEAFSKASQHRENNKATSPSPSQHSYKGSRRTSHGSHAGSRGRSSRSSTRNSSGSSKGSQGSRGSLRSLGLAVSSNVRSARSTSTSSTVRYSQEPFESYQFKVAQLCRDANFGEPLEIQRMTGGGYNRIIGLKFPSGKYEDTVLRIPRGEMDDRDCINISDQVAVLLQLAQFDFLHIPSILAFDAVQDNAIRAPYVLQERLRGNPIQDVLYDSPLSQKLQITTLVAELLIKMESIKFERPGRLIAKRPAPRISMDPLSSTTGIELAGYRLYPVEDMPVHERQPLTSLIIELLEARKKDELEWPEMVEACERLQEIAKEMEEAGLMRTTDQDCVIWHWDLSASNILIDREVNYVPDKTPILTGPEKKPQGGRLGNPLLQKCHHSITFTSGEGIEKGQKHTIQVIVEGQKHQACKHKIDVVVGDSIGKTWRYSCEFHDSQSNQNGQVSSVSEAPQWRISGVLDWDDVISVPLVISRKAPTWLWCNEETRTQPWSGNRDVPPGKPRTQDELLIKAHFDQIMERALPGYIEDAYHRGIWLRALFRFGFEGFGHGHQWPRYSKFVTNWENYYHGLGR